MSDKLSNQYATTSHCKKCGSKLMKNAQYCLKCGSKVDIDETKENITDKEQNFNSKKNKSDVELHYNDSSVLSHNSTDQLKMYLGSTILGVLTIPAIIVALRLFFAFSSNINTTIGWITAICYGCLTVFYLYAVWYCMSAFPNIIQCAKEGKYHKNASFDTFLPDGRRKISYNNGLCAGIFGFILNYNVSHKKTGCTCYIVGILDIIGVLYMGYLTITIVSSLL